MAARQGTGDTIIVALGGNVAAGMDALRDNLVAAIRTFPSRGLHVMRRSRFWRSAAWPDPWDGDYLNAVVLVQTHLGPELTLAALHRIEAAFGRRRERPNAPRTLDLDLIAHGRTICTGPVVLPHPRAAERLFVMGPLAELIPDWRHPVNGESAAALARRASIGRDARPIAEA